MNGGIVYKYNLGIKFSGGVSVTQNIQAKTLLEALLALNRFVASNSRNMEIQAVAMTRME